MSSSRGHRSRILSGAILLIFFVLVAGCRQGPFAISTPTPSFTKTFPVAAEEPNPVISGNAGRGENDAATQAVFNRECNACHPGGGAGVGPGLKSLNTKMNAEAFARVVRNGAGMMPGFRADRVSDSAITGMWELLTGGVSAAAEKPAPAAQSPQTPAPKPQATVAAKGDQAAGGGAGQRVFEQQCNACHPEGGQGLGPAVKGLADRSTREAFNSVMREGKGMMPAFKADRLPDGDLEALWNYLRDLK